ncbi:MAG TPA: alpha/beta fold hydrolase, partial [Segeticoccus sp.]|nr:alpha/beta fold hydrolase [Segeticoccus sp.]
MTDPIDGGMLDVGDGHRIAWEVSGNPHGKPAVVLHGGPGSGAAPWWRGYFDPDRYRVVQFDQRGCGRSTPSAGEPAADLATNTTAHLVGDIERLRELLGVQRWLVLGGSWGSTLALAYAVEHPERVSELVLWALVTTRRFEVDWLTWGMGRLFPEEFAAFRAALPEGERDGNLPLAYHRLLMDPDPAVHLPASRAWTAWEDRIATLSGPVVSSERFEDDRFRL